MLFRSETGVKNLLGGHYDLILSLLFVNSSLIIMGVWYEYMMGSLTLRWIPSIFDSIIPFLLGFTEFLMIISVSLKSVFAWYCSMALICIVSIIAYNNQYRECYINYDINRLALNSLGNMTLYNQLMVLASGLVLLIFAVIEGLYGLNSPYLLIISTIMIIEIGRAHV